MWVLLNIVFHGEVLLASRPTPKLEDHPSSAVRDCLFNLFAATLHIGGRSSIRNLRTRHAVVTGTHLSQFKYKFVLDSRAEEITVCNVANSYSTDVKEMYNMGKCVELFCDTIERFIDEDRTYNFT